MYFLEATKVIQSNWLFSSNSLKDNEELVAEVVIKILSNGKIDFFMFDKKSGNIDFDNSVENAIMSSSPLPAFFDGMSGEFIELGMRFTPKY